MPLYVGVPDPSRNGRDGKPGVRNTCQFFTSPDLKSWTYTGTFAGEVYECPGLIELPVDGNPSRTRWVLWGADGAYWVGTFNGLNFTAEAGPMTGDYGPNFYAAQAWDALAERRVVLMNEKDIQAQGFTAGEKVDLFNYDDGVERVAPLFVVVPYAIPERNAVTYFPETNVLVSVNNTVEESNMPASKYIKIQIRQHNPALLKQTV